MLLPPAIVFFFLYSLGFPAVLCWILFTPANIKKIKADQLLRAQGLGDTKDTNPQCYHFRCVDKADPSVLLDLKPVSELHCLAGSAMVVSTTSSSRGSGTGCW
jgi:hypothetical protein